MSEMKTSEAFCRDRRSKDFFDPEKAFFLIDSEHLDEVETHFYGYSVQSSGIYEEENLTAEAADALDGCGAYVYVERMADGKIRIRQDFNGCWGIYLYRNGDYFALSSSFLRLLEYVRTRFPLSIDRDYLNQYLLAGLCSHAYSESAVKEIKLVDKDAVVLIDPNTATLRFESTSHVDESIAMDTSKGMAVLDHWFDKWTALFRNLKAHTSNIQTSLSGGFDSRITFLLMLCSGINLSEIQVYSIHDGLHTHAEDYEIASEIADYYGFKLNNKALDRQALHYSLKDSLNISFYTKLPVHKQLFFKTAKFVEKRYVVPGSGGEALRAHWDQSPQSFDDEQAARSRLYSRFLANEMSTSVRKINQSAYRAADEKFGVQEENSIRYPMYLYRLTRCRHHFGKEAVERLRSNDYELTPLLDPDLWSLKLETADCQDWNLLMALIYVRYCPSLLNFRFEGGRSINPETIAYAQKLNERFPRPAAAPDGKADASFSVITRDEEVLEVLRSGQDNPALPAGTPERYLEAVYGSCSFQKLFETCFDREIYDFAKRYAVEKDFHPMQECYAVIGVTKVISDVLVSRQICPPSLPKNLDFFLEENPYEPDDLAALINRYRDDLTGRVDVMVTGEGAGLELAEISDPRATVRQPEWLQKDGVGYVIEAYHGTLDLKLHILAGEALSIKLRGRDVRNEKGERVPYWIAYQNVICNGKAELQEPRNICHDKPFSLSRPVQDGEIVTLHLEWMPCRYTTERADALEKKLADQEKELSSAKAALSSTETELSALKTELSARKKELSSTKKELSTRKKELSSLKKRNAALKEKNASMRSSVAWRLGRALTWPVRKLKGLLAKRQR